MSKCNFYAAITNVGDRVMTAPNKFRLCVVLIFQTVTTVITLSPTLQGCARPASPPLSGKNLFRYGRELFWLARGTVLVG